MNENTIDISKLDKAEVLAALYNASRPQGLGFLHYTPEEMTRDQAQEIIKNDPYYSKFDAPYFDYFNGRMMKFELKDELDPWGYDRDNGQGAAARALGPLFAKLEVAK